MRWLNRISAATAAVRLIDESLYAQAFDELNQGIRRDGLWAKALANAEGNEAKARGLYLQYRVQSYKDEAALLEQSTVPSLNSITHPPSHSAAQHARVVDDNKQGRASNAHGRQYHKQAAQPGLPQMSAPKKEAPSWASDNEELEGFRNSVKILAAQDGVSKSYVYECMRNDLVRSTILHHILPLEERGCTYMEQVGAAVDEVRRRWNLLPDVQQQKYHADDSF